MSDCTCVRGDDGQVRVPRSRCPQHGWADAPTPAPALTDEQVDNMAGTFCDAYLRTLPPFGHPVGKDLFRRWYAAIIARAKRDERERIVRDLREWAAEARRVGYALGTAEPLDEAAARIGATR